MDLRKREKPGKRVPRGNVGFSVKPRVNIGELFALRAYYHLDRAEELATDKRVKEAIRLVKRKLMTAILGGRS